MVRRSAHRATARLTQVDTGLATYRHPQRLAQLLRRVAAQDCGVEAACRAIVVGVRRSRGEHGHG